MMRPWPAFLASLVLGILPMPAVEAHGEALVHVNPKTIELGPKASFQYGIEFEEGDLRKDWVFLLNAAASNGTGPVDFQLWDAKGLVDRWTVPADAVTRHLTARIRDTGPHGLVVTNSGPDELEATFFYDASCNCAGKPIPLNLTGAALLFQVDAREGDVMRTVFPEPDVHTLRVTHALRVNLPSHWPADFRVWSTSPNSTVDSQGRPAHVFDWTADRTARFYFFVEATSTNQSRFDPSLGDLAILSVYVEPSNTKVGSEAPGVGTAALTMVLAIACFAAAPRPRT